MKIAFLTIATYKYAAYAFNLIESLNKYAFNDTNNDISLIVCSDHDIKFDNTQRVKGYIHNITHIPFPLISLMRYHYYSALELILQEYDYVYHIDCDMQLNELISNEILGNTVCVEHPGYIINVPPERLPYDRKQDSNAYVSLIGGTKYYQNCFQGGKTSLFLKMCRELKHKIEEDLRKNYIALWHDESYMNRYMVDNPPDLVLPFVYAYPELYDLGPIKKIIHLHKNNLEIRKTN
jgi:hypothetical protein